jgi:hypothetical protein
MTAYEDRFGVQNLQLSTFNLDLPLLRSTSGVKLDFSIFAETESEKYLKL